MITIKAFLHSEAVLIIEKYLKTKSLNELRNMIRRVQCCLDNDGDRFQHLL